MKSDCFPAENTGKLNVLGAVIHVGHLKPLRTTALDPTCAHATAVCASGRQTELTTLSLCGKVCPQMDRQCSSSFCFCDNHHNHSNVGWKGLIFISHAGQSPSLRKGTVGATQEPGGRNFELFGNFIFSSYYQCFNLYEKCDRIKFS